MQALGEMLQERDNLRLWQTYMAELAWIGARAQYKEFPFPSYIELTQKKSAPDSRTSEQIRADLIARLSKDVSE